MPGIGVFVAFGFWAVANAMASEPPVFLVGSVDGRPPCRENAYAMSIGSSLTLSAVVLREGRLFSPVEAFIEREACRKVQGRLEAQPDISWYLLRPKLKEYSNLWKPDRPEVDDIHIEPIEYEKVALPEFAGQNQVEISATLSGFGLGTSYLGVEIETAAGSSANLPRAFSDATPLHLKYPSIVVQVVYRLDDSYLGYLTELYRTPFVIGPRRTDHGVHETDARMGSDCAAFAIFGKRRQGFPVPYCGPAGIFRYLSEVEKMPARPVAYQGTEVYVTQDDRRVLTGPDGLQAGDIVHFGEQVSVFYRDEGIRGVLDKDDLLLQCYGDQPGVTTFECSGFYHLAVRLFRWNDALRIGAF